jgi:hypothetical protein
MTFESVKAQKSEVFRIRVRRAISDMLGHNAAVTIFAAKNVLGWTDKMEETVKNEEPPIFNLNLVSAKKESDDAPAD